MDLIAALRANRAAFLLALQFLTRLRVPVAFSPEALRESPRWYPSVGVVVGLLAGAVYWIVALRFSPTLAALAATAAAIMVTGALHEDGLADLCDGLGGHASRDRALAIMRDSRIGTYGTLGLGLMLAARITALAALPNAAVPFVLIAGHAASRASMLWVMATVRYARDTGAASGVAGGVDSRALQIGLITAALAAVPLIFVLPIAAIAMGAVGLVAAHYAIRQRFENRLGGYTGDCLGAVQQFSELGFYLGTLLMVAA